MSEPTQTCQLCGRQVVVKQDGRGFPPDIAKRRLVKICQANGCASEPKYRAGVHGFAAMPAKPPVTLLSPAGDMPPVGAYLADSLTRVVVVTDEPAPTAVEGWNDIGERECWPRLMESARRRGLQPQGTWTMILDPGPDWRRHIAVEVQAKVDGALAHQPELRVLCVGLLVDSASVRAVPDE